MSEQEKLNETVTQVPSKSEIKVPKREIIIGIVSVLVVIGLGIAAIFYRNDFLNTKVSASYGLIGVVIVSFLAGSILCLTAIPIPYWLLVMALPTALSVQWGLLAPLFVGLASAFGMTLGHMPTFMLGYGGRSISNKLSTRFGNNWYGRLYAKLVNWSKKHGWIAVTLNSALFNPLHLAMTLAFGSIRYPPWKFFIYSFLGNAFKSLLLAFIGYFGVSSLLKLFGM